jgi:hypothetical protein
MLLRSKRKEQLKLVKTAALIDEDYDYKNELRKLTLYSLENPPVNPQKELTLLDHVAIIMIFLLLFFSFLKNDFFLV